MLLGGRRGAGPVRSREFTLNGTDNDSHREQGSMIRRYIAWRNRHTNDERLRRIVKRTNVA
ncbi:hypothetical protein [Streptosporangium sp. NPDC050280]|uniref:hypothetical protein n=1 Tax=unclassified Streptosporangium TaxID=2632669 RepID=UPI003440CE19